ncbi:MAG: nitrilase-related carbon-nitrogen hydrolase [Nanoarchaeota archaeon]|nr:nitrilase-related carbon-nitrogen hydrolase [Nanoarchaeota archaeon]
MKIALAQINPIVGDIKGNTKKIISIIKKTRADIVVFPELSITGYSPQDLLLKHNFVEENINALGKIAKNAKNKIAIVGFIERKDKHLYNSAAIVKNQRLAEIHHKICLPNYTIFDEKRWFEEGDNATIFEFQGKKIGLNICEDIWFPETTKRQKDKGVELIINISASPYRKGKFEAIENTLKQRWEENKIPIIYVNQVGSQDGIVYYGHSMYFRDGKVVKKCKDFEEDILIVEV